MFSVEFYVIAAFVAAAIVGFAAMPHRRGEVRTFLYAGELHTGDFSDTAPAITAKVDNHGRLRIYRHGLDGIGTDGAYSIAVNISGFDVTIDERLTPGRLPASVKEASVATDCFAAERYHILYRSEFTGRSAAFSINIRPGNTVERMLS